mgnify:CR=1 FL=1
MIDEGYLARLLIQYKRWIADGKLPYGYGRDTPRQHYYDSYHDAISQVDETTYHFNIQTDDSPDGDTWIEGTFRYDPSGITILTQRAYIS